MAHKPPGRRPLPTDRTKPPTNDSYHDIDPSGDLMLEVGAPPTSIRIRASSKALGLASPVFAAMFSPRFSEGNPASAGEVRSIPLPDDDASAMITLCNAVHLRSSRVSVANFASVERLSVVCDKYDCAEAMSPWSARWLSRWQEGGEGEGETGCLKMICVAYGFDDPEAFWNATSGVLKYYDASAMVSAGGSEPGFAILPEQLLDELDTHRKTLLREIHKKIEATIDPFLKESNARIASYGFPQGGMKFNPPRREAAHSPEPSFGGFGSQRSPFSQRSAPPPPQPPTRHFDDGTNSSCSSAMKIGLFLLELSRLELWPLSEKVMASSVQAVLEKASRFEGVGEPSSGCKCRTCKVSFKELMTALATDQLGKVKGLCLGCVRSGRLMPDGGNCQNKEFCTIGDV